MLQFSERNTGMLASKQQISCPFIMNGKQPNTNLMEDWDQQEDIVNITTV